MTTMSAGTSPADKARGYARQPTEWPVAPRFNAERRWYGRLGADESHEAWLLTWLPGQGTDLHDHSGSAGTFVVVRGSLTGSTVDSGVSRELNRRCVA